MVWSRQLNDSLIRKLEARVGRELGVSSWFTIDQDRIDRFGGATDDPDPMHVDPDWAREHSPFGRTVAFGFLTMSMLTALYHDVMQYDRTGGQGGYGLNYGFDGLRLVCPVPVGSEVRGRFRLLGIEERPDKRYLLRLDVKIEIRGRQKPALVGEWLVMWVAD